VRGGVDFLGFFSIHNVPTKFPSSFQKVSQDVPNSTTILSHLFCPKLFSFHLICGSTLTLSLIWMLRHVGSSKQQNKHLTTQKTLSCHV